MLLLSKPPLKSKAAAFIFICIADMELTGPFLVSLLIFFFSLTS